MSDDTNKSAAKKNTDTEEKPKAVKKSTTAKKKIKEKDDSASANESNKNKVIEKLQSMGVMSGGKPKMEEPGNKHEKGELVKLFTASAVAVLLVSSFVWALNKEAAERKSVSNINYGQAPVTNTMQPNYSSPWQSTGNNPYNNVNRHPGANYPTQIDANNNYEKQQQKWIQQRLQQQKWLKQQQQEQEQYKKWAQQQQQQQQAQYKKWVQQQKVQQAQQQQGGNQQQQGWNQQQQGWNQQQPNYTYQPYTGYQGQQQPQVQNYNYAPGYQQPQQYYRR